MKLTHRRRPAPSTELALPKTTEPPTLPLPLARGQLPSKLLSSPIQMISQPSPTEQWSKQKVTYPYSRQLKFQVVPLHLLELGCQLTYHLRVGSVAGRAPEHQLREMRQVLRPFQHGGRLQVACPWTDVLPEEGR
jgi:hypothetical protein